MKRRICLIVLVMMVLGTIPSVFGDMEPNDDLNHAEPLTPGTPVEGSINETDKSDFYEFEVTEGKIIVIEATVGTLSTDKLTFKLYDPNKNNVKDFGEVASGNTQTFRYITSVETEGKYYLEVTAWSAINSYTIKVVLEAQNDGGKGKDAPGNINNAFDLGDISEIEGIVGDGDKKDYYKIFVPNGTEIDIEFQVGTKTTDSLDLTIYDSSKKKMHKMSVNSGTSTTYKHITSHKSGGYYFLEAGGYYGDEKNDYTIRVTRTNQNDGNEGVDAPDEITDAIKIENNEIKGVIGYDDSGDFFAIHVINGSSMIINFTTGTKTDDSLKFRVYNQNKDEIKEIRVNSGTTETFEHITSDRTGGDYYIEVVSWYGEDVNEYIINWNVIPQNDAESGKDAPSDIGNNSIEINDDMTWSGLVGDDDSSDSYKFNVTGGDTFTIKVTAGDKKEGDLQIKIFNPNKEQIHYVSGIKPETSIIYSRTTWNYTGGIYYLTVVSIFGHKNTYTLELKLEPQNDAESGGDAGETDNPDDVPVPPNPTPVGTGIYYGFMKDDDIRDIYVFQIPAGKKLIVNVTPEDTLAINLFIMGKNGAEQKYVEVVYKGKGVELHAEYAPPAGEKEKVFIWLKLREGYGNYTLEISLEDSGGGVGQDNDTTPPTVSIVSPLEGSNVDVTFTVTILAADDNNVTKVEVSTDKVNWKGCKMNLKLFWECDLTLIEGDHTIYVRAFDASGNIGEDAVNITVKKGASPQPKPKPSISITEPKEGATLYSKKIVVKGTASDKTGIMKVEVSIDNKTWTEASGTTSWQANLTLKEGKNTIYVRATNLIGEVSYDSISVEVKIKGKTDRVPGFELVILILVILTMSAIRRKVQV